MKYKVIVEPLAEEQIHETYHYIALDSVEHAVLWSERVEAAIKSLADLPRRFSLAPENAAFPVEVRHIVLGNYRILFSIGEDAVHVLQVRHAARRSAKPGEES